MDLATQEDNDNIYFYTKESPWSNHFQTQFTIEDTTYNSMEHYFMAKKAIYFKDTTGALKKIMAAQSAADAKAAGKTVRPFRRGEWERDEQVARRGRPLVSERREEHVEQQACQQIEEIPPSAHFHVPYGRSR